MGNPDSKIPDSLKSRAKEGILSHVLVTENLLAAEDRADSLVEQARLNEAISVVEELENEVAGMTISPRFSRTKKPSESVYNRGISNLNLTDLTEDEYKRATLLMSLKSLKNKINSTIISGLKNIVLDIERTKQK